MSVKANRAMVANIAKTLFMQNLLVCLSVEVKRAAQCASALKGAEAGSASRETESWQDTARALCELALGYCPFATLCATMCAAEAAHLFAEMQ
jgi:hypothetical protein